MMRPGRASLLVAFSVLTAAATADAGCAWILWNDEARLDYDTSIEARLWHTIAAAQKKPECEARLRQEIEHVTHADNLPKGVLIKAHGDAVQLVHLRADKPAERIARVQTFR